MNLSKFNYQPEWGFVRTPARSTELQVLNFEQNYDYTTLWNDVIQINPNAILIIGPPLYDTVQWINLNCQFIDDKGQKLTWRYSNLDRASVIRLDTMHLMPYLIFKTPFQTHKIQINYCENKFKNRKTIVTISKNHPIDWLKQWIDYHKTVHNVDGLLLYNNQSTLYTSQELETALYRDDVAIQVVDYDVPFGVMGGGLWEWQGKSGNYLPWDSDFSQYVMLEHAKWRFLYDARLVINADTDELLVIKNSNLDGIAEYCASGEHSVLLYDGIWIEPIDSTTGVVAKDVDFCNRHFSNYWHTTHGDGRGIGVKWMLNPQRNIQYQWHLHKTYGPHIKTDQITFGHFFAMNTSWSYQRDEFLGDLTKLTSFDLLHENLNLWQQQGKFL